ncbi:MAG TPA: methyltransferase type 12 [Geobacter sp.]|nr:methyltransferase type 12 [Geobacter sp.]
MTDSISLPLADAGHLAQQLLRCQLFEEAEGLLGRILQASPDHLDALHFYSLLCHQQNRLEEAERLIRRILELAPGNADAHNNLGNVLQSMKRHEEAEASYFKALESYPGHASAYNNLGVILAGNGRTEVALEAFRNAAELNPESVEFRSNLANALRRSGKLDEAVTAYQEAIRIDPGHEGAWKGLARCFLLADRNDLAVQVLEEWLRLQPGDQSIQYLLEAYRGANTPDRAPNAYIQKVFDGFADQFDTHLEHLGYRAPQLICTALASLLPAPKGTLEILDAGCGTGLCGPLLKPHATNLTGIDLSVGMLAKAEERLAYDSLVQAELTDYLGRHAGCFDAVVSSDTLCYFGDLEQVLGAACTSLKSGGYLAFTLEAAADGDSDVKLEPSGRFVHRHSYLSKVLADAGLEICHYSSDTIRQEGGEAVTGHLVVARKKER